MKPSFGWQLKSSSTEMLSRCLMILPLLGRSFQLSEIQKGTLPRITPALFLDTRRHAPNGVPESSTVLGAISAAMDPFGG